MSVCVDLLSVCVHAGSYRVHVFRGVSRGRVIIRLLRRLRLSLLLLPDLDDNFPVGREKKKHTHTMNTMRQKGQSNKKKTTKKKHTECRQACLLQC